jgi:hypothetical protein
MLPVRSSMSDIISRVRTMIFDPSGANQFFADIDIQTTLDESVDFIRYEPLAIAPTIINTASTNNQASVIFIEYFSRYQWIESDAVLQGINIPTNAAWSVLTPTQSDFINGHFWFESPTTEFTSPTVPGQYPPVFMTGKYYDLFRASADLLEFWGAALASRYDVTADGQSMRRSQLMTAKLTLAEQYKRKAKPKIAAMVRDDVAPDMVARKMRLLDSSEDIVKGY